MAHWYQLGSNDQFDNEVFKGRLSNIWIKDAFDDMASSYGNYASGSTPTDNVNGCELFFKPDSLVNAGTASTTFNTSPSTPPSGNW